MNFKEDLKKLNIELINEASLNFEEYYKFLVEYNEHVNLTAIKIGRASCRERV